MQHALRDRRATRPPRRTASARPRPPSATTTSSVDGSGYPDALVGEAIPIEARVIAVADAFSAITADRPYRSARTPADAIAELRAGAGRHHDPHAVEALARALAAGEPALAALGRRKAA